MNITISEHHSYMAMAIEEARDCYIHNMLFDC